MNPAVRRWLRAWRWLAAGVAVAALVWAGGLAWFIYVSLTTTADSTTVTDAIVVLTGGRLRLEAGLDLLEAGKAQKLFVSGVNPRVDRSELLRVAAHFPAPDPDRIILGHSADNTFGNARETAEWMQREGYRSLRLVTSWYHIARSLLEFERAMPNAVIVADPVPIGRAEPESWRDWLDIALLAVNEYDKFLATLLRHSFGGVWPRAEGASASPASAASLSRKSGCPA